MDRGWYSDDYLIDETRTDYEIHFPNGSVFKQNSAFESRTEDWNHDGDVYELFGAFFFIEEYNRNEFITPDQMISLCVHDGCSIPGLMTKEEYRNKESLAEKIKTAENRTGNPKAFPEDKYINKER